MTRWLREERREERRRDWFFFGGGVVVHGGGVLLDLLQMLGILGGLVEIRVRDLLMSMKQLLALVISSTKLTGDLFQVMVRVSMIVQFVSCLKHLKKRVMSHRKYNPSIIYLRTVLTREHSPL